MSDEKKVPDVREQVREGYGRIAEIGVFKGEGLLPVAGDDEPGACCEGGGCCGPTTFDAADLAEKLGYSGNEVAELPDGANMGLSCGNPTALASLRPGEVVMDLGSGGGFDVFLAAPRVGSTGRVIGVDMTPDMLDKARRNAIAFSERSGLDNVEFRLGEIENLPAADNSVDVVISNCVLNLSPDKARVWREIHRVLKPGGRVAISDLALLAPLPEGVLDIVEAWIGCVSGAVLVEEMKEQVRDAGLVDAEFETDSGYVTAMTDYKDPLYQKIVAALPEGAGAADYVTSLSVTAVKR